MGQITSSIGLISGIDTGDIVNQLIDIESRPKLLVEQRNQVLESQKVAFQDVSANLLATQGAADRLSSDTLFDQVTASSTDETVITASASAGATPGNYTFRVAQLVGTQQLITTGFPESTGRSISDTAGTLTFDRGEARLDSKTNLSLLNGGTGIERGLMRVTDRSGNTSLIDLSTAVDVDDVIDTINSTTGVNVVAAIDGDRLTVTDVTGSTNQALVIQDVGGTATATSLGLAGTAAAELGTRLEGTTINSIGERTLLSQLNDGNGVRVAAGGDLTLQTGAGTFTVDLSDASTLGDVFDLISAETGGDVTASVSAEGQNLTLTSASGSLVVANDGDSQAASDLGLTASPAAGGTIQGDRVIADINSTLIKFVQGGQGIGGVIGEGSTPLLRSTRLDDLRGGLGVDDNNLPLNRDIDVYARDDPAQLYKINPTTLVTVGDLIDQFDSRTGGKVTLSIDGDRLVATDNTGGTGNLVIEDRFDSNAGESLGLLVNDAVDSVTGVPLNPVGPAPTDAVITLSTSAGGTANVNLGDARSISDVIELINQSGVGVTASLNNAGDGLALIADPAAGTLTVSDQAGSAAAQLGLVGTFAEGSAQTGSLSRQYVTSATTLDKLNVARGRFRITDSDGRSARVDLTQGNENTLQDVISEINSRGLAVNARLNDAGNGLLIEDTGSGVIAMEIEDDGSTTAADLNIAGAAASSGANIDGSFRRTVSYTEDDDLTEIAQLINAANAGVTAEIINDGSTGAPYRLSFTATDSGSAGSFVLDDGGLGLNSIQLAEAQDAVAFYGGGSPKDALAITSTTNTLEDAIPGVTIDLLSVSDNPVQVTISEDNAAVTSAAQDFVTNFNGVIETINSYDSYDSENEVRGLLLGDSTLANIRTRLYNSVIGVNSELTGQYKSLAQVGIRVGTGARLQIDQARFNEALREDPDAVQALFAFEQFAVDPETGEEDADTVIARGVGVELAELLDSITNSNDGLVQSALDRLDAQVESNNRKIESLDDRIETKRLKLEREFAAMESALADLNDQSAALGSLSSIRNNSNSNN